MLSPTSISVTPPSSQSIRSLRSAYHHRSNSYSHSHHQSDALSEKEVEIEPPPPPRTLDSVRLQAARSLALRALRKAETIIRPCTPDPHGAQSAENGREGGDIAEEEMCKIGVLLTLSTSSYSASLSPEKFLSLIAASLDNIIAATSPSIGDASTPVDLPPRRTRQMYIFAFGAPASSPDPDYAPLSPSPLSSSSSAPEQTYPSHASPLLVCSSSPALLSACTTLLASKFLGRVLSSSALSPLLPPSPLASPPAASSSLNSQDRSEPRQHVWLAHIAQLGTSPYDTFALWDALRKVCSVPLLSSTRGKVGIGAPLGLLGVEGVLMRARARLERISVKEAWEELSAVRLAREALSSRRNDDDTEDTVYFPLGDGKIEEGVTEEAGAILVDIRSEEERNFEGGIPGAVCVDRNRLEWTFDPTSPERYVDSYYLLSMAFICCDAITADVSSHSLAIATRYDLRVILLSSSGRASSLAAASLQDVGLWRATDVVGGFRQWKEDGMPCFRGTAPPGE